MENSSFGVGSQLDSFSPPGEIGLNIIVSEPLGLVLSVLFLVPSE